MLQQSGFGPYGILLKGYFDEVQKYQNQLAPFFEQVKGLYIQDQQKRMQQLVQRCVVDQVFTTFSSRIALSRYKLTPLDLSLLLNDLEKRGDESILAPITAAKLREALVKGCSHYFWEKNQLESACTLSKTMHALYPDSPIVLRYVHWLLPRIEAPYFDQRGREILCEDEKKADQLFQLSLLGKDLAYKILTDERLATHYSEAGLTKQLTYLTNRIQRLVAERRKQGSPINMTKAHQKLSQSQQPSGRSTHSTVGCHGKPDLFFGCAF